MQRHIQPTACYDQPAVDQAFLRPLKDFDLPG
jgi:hypothetical protein